MIIIKHCCISCPKYSIVPVGQESILVNGVSRSSAEKKDNIDNLNTMEELLSFVYQHARKSW